MSQSLFLLVAIESGVGLNASGVDAARDGASLRIVVEVVLPHSSGNLLLLSHLLLMVEMLLEVVVRSWLVAESTIHSVHFELFRAHHRVIRSWHRHVVIVIVRRQLSYNVVDLVHQRVGLGLCWRLVELLLKRDWNVRLAIVGSWWTGASERVGASDVRDFWQIQVVGIVHGVVLGSTHHVCAVADGSRKAALRSDDCFQVEDLCLSDLRRIN